MPTSTDARDVMDDRVLPQDPASHHHPYSGHHHGHGQARPNFRYETTTDGDIVVVDPSYNPAVEDAGPDPTHHHQQQQHHHHHQQQQQRHQQHQHQPPITAWPSQELRKPSSMKRHGRHHSRNLSAHFFDATKITASDDDDEAQVDKTFTNKGKLEGHPGALLSASPAPGQKHRRMFSGDVSNPPLAHRRINSIGNAAAVDRFMQRPRGRHHREDSAGLDILSAAADVTNDELADAAGARTTPVWEGPPPTGGPGGGTGLPEHHHNRYNSLDFYDYGTAPPPSSRPPGPPGPPGPMKPPPARGFAHPHAHAAPGYGPPPPPPGHHHPPAISYHHPPPYPPSSFYPPHPPPPGHPTAGRTSYPVQYSHRHPPPPDMYKAQMYAPPPPPPPPPAPGPEEATGGRQQSPTAPFGDEKIESDERLFARGGPGSQQTTYATTMMPAPAVPQRDPKHGNVDPADPAIAVNAPPPPLPSTSVAHHRKLSSFSSINGLLGASIFSPGGREHGEQEHPLKSHHRSTSSSVSFMQGLDALEGSDVMFLRNLHASTPHYGGPPPLSSAPQLVASESRGMAPRRISNTTALMNHNGSNDDSAEESKLASGGTSKRVRRKCTIQDCPNRVVQGGLCISHGAKRKTCNHPGCNKNVKKAGLCSTHGPARRRCDQDGCGKVAVQGGRCIAHGAKKKLCSVETCKKQAILSGMCKKHHDKLGGIDPNNPPMCLSIGGENRGPAHQKGHTRGLSIFQDLSADAVHNLLAGDDPLAM